MNNVKKTADNRINRVEIFFSFSYLEVAESLCGLANSSSEEEVVNIRF